MISVSVKQGPPFRSSLIWSASGSLKFPARAKVLAVSTSAKSRSDSWGKTEEGWTGKHLAFDCYSLFSSHLCGFHVLGCFFVCPLDFLVRWFVSLFVRPLWHVHYVHCCHIHCVLPGLSKMSTIAIELWVFFPYSHPSKWDHAHAMQTMKVLTIIIITR